MLIIADQFCLKNPSSCSKDDGWKLVEFENWAKAGEAAPINYVLRYTSPEVGGGRVG